MTGGYDREAIAKMLEDIRRDMAVVEAKHLLTELLICIKPLMEQGPSRANAELAHQHGKEAYESFAKLLLRREPE
jgi:hypothetical protein